MFYHVLYIYIYIHAYTHTHIYIYTFNFTLYVIYVHVFVAYLGVSLKMGIPKPSVSGTFAAVAPWFGLPLLGYGLGAQFELVRYTKDGARLVPRQVVEMEEESNIDNPRESMVLEYLPTLTPKVI